MKKSKVKSGKGVVKGAPSGFVISIAIHAAAFALAGMLVVFNVVQKEEKKFIPPKPVDRPKMKLKKPKVKVKKSSRPKSTTRIVTKVQKASMPDIQLPEMSGIGEGLSGDIVGFDMAPDLEEVSFFGSEHSIGNDFVGTYYDMNRDRSGRPVPMDPDTMANIVKNFLIKGWKSSVFSRYYQAPKKLFTTHFCVPTELSTLGPAAFGQEDGASWCWLAHYKGQLVYPEDIRIRFWGQGDDYMIVRVDGEIVLLATWPQGPEPYLISVWDSDAADNRKYAMGNNLSVVGDWIDLKAGEPLDMEVLIGEGGGGLFTAMLCVEVEGEEYPKNPFMLGPTLPIFKTEELSQDMVDSIHFMLAEGDACVTNGPVFKDY
ncbi:hypothetical protein EGM51_00355 [Verrucomicrobia bacterium S94]|nr:hypothetical protein EGM51_00355 [Verrucomicrobia bacterium S94]